MSGLNKILAEWLVATNLMQAFWGVVLLVVVVWVAILAFQLNRHLEEHKRKGE